MTLALRRRLTSAVARIAKSQRRRRALGQRGAVLVEAAIALPTVTLLLFGILEYGLLFGDGMDLASAIRAASRTGAAMTTTASTTDFSILQSVKATSGRASSQITRVVVYRADGVGGAPSASCQAGIAVVGTCNVYTYADLNKSASELSSSGESDAWPPQSRIPGTDYIGVWAVVNHHWITGFMGSGRTITDSAVMRVQPLPTTGQANDTQYWPLPEVTTLLTTTTTAKPTTTTTTAKPTTTSTLPTTTTIVSGNGTGTGTGTGSGAGPGYSPPCPGGAICTGTSVNGGTGNATTTTAKPTTTTAKPTTTTAKPTTTTAKPTTTTTSTPIQPPHF